MLSEKVRHADAMRCDAMRYDAMQCELSGVGLLGEHARLIYYLSDNCASCALRWRKDCYEQRINCLFPADSRRSKGLLEQPAVSRELGLKSEPRPSIFAGCEWSQGRLGA